MTRLSLIRLGTRGSELALKQTTIVTALLQNAHPALAVERKIITTTGDKRQDLRLAEVAASTQGIMDKGVFIKELEVALESKDVDAAVHSLKDMPSELDAHFSLVAILPRAMVEDVLITAKPCPGGLAGLPPGARVGTSSVRRARQLLALRPDAQVVEIRGNVPTRIRKVMGEQPLDAVLLAAAGLDRLGLLTTGHVTLDGVALHAALLDPMEFLPAAGQGAIAIEIVRHNDEVRRAFLPLNDAVTQARVIAEREFLRILGGGCQTPVGAHTWVEGNTLHMKVKLFSETDPTAPPTQAEGSASIASPLTLAKKLAKKLRQPEG